MDMAVWIYLYLTVGKLLQAATVIVSIVFVVWAFVTFFAGCFSGFGTTENPYSQGERQCYVKFKEYAKPVCVLFVTVIAIGSFYPSKEDIGWIVGGSVATVVATSEEAQKLPDNVVSAANSFLEGISDDEIEGQEE